MLSVLVQLFTQLRILRLIQSFVQFCVHLCMRCTYVYLSSQLGARGGGVYRLVQLQSLVHSSFQSLVYMLYRLLVHGLTESLVHSLFIALFILNFVDSLVHI
jgi:hypothetical protein